MVVCEGSFVVSTIASLMMNGVCCLWQMEEENERQLQQREAIRQDIRVEYERQRQIEQEIWHQRQREYQEAAFQAENWYTDSPSAHTDQRRRKLLADKRRLSLQSQQENSVRHQRTEDQRDEPMLVQRPCSLLSRQPIKKRKVRIATSPRRRDEFPVEECVAADAHKTFQQWNDMSSLMDSALEDEYVDVDLDEEMIMLEEETITSLVDVPLQ